MAQKIGILTGGGDCPGLNPAIRGTVIRALGLGYECVGLIDGWKGLVQGNAIPLGLKEVEDLIGKGGTALGTSRTNPFKREGAVQACLDNFKKLDLHALVAMGGEDTLGVAAQLFKLHGANVVGVPKTMDNDLSATDFTFGFDTASTVAVDAAERLKDTGKSHHRVMVLEVMGRHAGWVALYTAIASGADAVCLPERKPDMAQIAARVKKAHERKGFALVVASEAVELPNEGGEQKLDEFGHTILKDRGVGETLAKLLEKETGLETRHAVLGHVQRGGPPTLFDRMLATRVGVKAAELVQKKRFGQMVALRGNEVVAVPLEEAVAKLKTVTEDWLQLADSLMGMIQDDEQKFQRKTVLIKRSLQLRYIAMLFVCIVVAVAIVGVDFYWTLYRIAANENPAILPVLEKLQQGLLVKFILYSGIIAIVSLFISNRIAGPVYRFEQSALVVGSGDLTHRVRLRRGDEFMELQDEFNDMVSRLQGKALQDRNLVERLSQRLAKLSLEAQSDKEKQEYTSLKNEVDHLGTGFKV